MATTTCYVPIFHLLDRGWIRFVFYFERDKDNILSGGYYWDNSILSLKIWIPLVDPMREGQPTIIMGEVSFSSFGVVDRKKINLDRKHVV